MNGLNSRKSFVIDTCVINRPTKTAKQWKKKTNAVHSMFVKTSQRHRSHWSPQLFNDQPFRRLIKEGRTKPQLVQRSKMKINGLADLTSICSSKEKKLIQRFIWKMNFKKASTAMKLATVEMTLRRPLSNATRFRVRTFRFQRIETVQL